MINNIKRGEIYYADLSPAIGSEQDGTRPVLILQNDIGNCYSPTTVIAAITSIPRKKPFQPTHVKIKTGNGLQYNSIVMLEQLRTIDKSRLSDYIGKLDENTTKEVDHALAVSVGLNKRRIADEK